ncbi:ubiquitin carboxyl-terminal hydrolase-domain-containing protein [Zychaea mexicana]|uniref:ubiquitin carboxyl-terminal hydrolase-domain-containing protein n=1 Tax=Zychaea mexicana TaxID=64656 RepID=UPI0022FE49EA|nr:ubiquitin carboxyl-terminal hydrolase-domain-containing protein [Zychaea mexicana]KAI9489877.1 ubiquitin carboxyl-terminal hydrolase-domain-containing protein [Zychaea mexicana]
MKPLTLFKKNSLVRKWSIRRQNNNNNKKNKPPKKQLAALTKEQESAMASLSEYASRNFENAIEEDKLRSLLEDNNWNLKRAMAELNDCEEAYHGLLHGPPPANESLLGCENDGGTSCYIDALLFAMYTSLTAFDPLLTTDTSSGQAAKRDLQTSLRLFVNIMRNGQLVKKHIVRRLRKSLEEAAWRGRNERGFWKQEDASELLLFLTETFDLPFLPFQMRLFHGANRDVDDDRVTTDRVLSLSIPSDTTKVLRLEDILFEHFYNSIVTGVKRQVDWHEAQSHSPPGSPTSAISTSSIAKNNIIFKEHQRQQEIAVNAWQVLELLPFYSGISEQGVRIESQNQGAFPDSRMVLPIILKRYRCTALGRYIKDQRSVIIPPDIHFNKFLNQNAEDPVCDTCGRKVEGVMRLRSVVCHKGSSPHSGHYIAYSRTVDRDNEVWLKLGKVKTLTGRQHEQEIYRELGKDGYLFFYELDKACDHPAEEKMARDDGRRASSSSSGTDKDERAGILQKIHYAEEENSAPMLNPAPPSLPRRHAPVVPPELPPRSPPVPVHDHDNKPTRPSLDPVEDAATTVVTTPPPADPPQTQRKSIRRSKDISCKTM